MPSSRGLALSRTGAKELSELYPNLASKTFPLDEPGQTVRLASSGRQLGYLEYVDSSQPLEELRAVVLLPGCPGSRFFVHPEVRNKGWVPGWRLIVLERPGIGLSDPPPADYMYIDFVADFREFCDLLGLKRVAVIGFSAGTPFATAIACVDPDAAAAAARGSSQAATADLSQRSTTPQRSQSASAATPGSGASSSGAEGSEALTAGKTSGLDSSTPTGEALAAAPTGKAGAAAAAASNGGVAAASLGSQPGQGPQAPATPAVKVLGAALVSAIGPPDTPNRRQGMAPMFQFAYWACGHMPRLVGWIVKSEATSFRKRPVSGLRSGFAPYSGKADVEALKRPEVEELFLESALELYSRGQEETLQRENLMFAARPWGFELSSCRMPVAIWQGYQDRGCTPAMATHLVEQMGSHAWVKLLQEQGHMLFFDVSVWREVVTWVDGLYGICGSNGSARSEGGVGKGEGGV